jgi:hypothetical protein
MTARRIGNLIAAVTLLATGSYVFVYLYRWEWNRALVSGILFVATEVAVVGWRLGDRLRATERRLADLAVAQQELRRQRLHESAPEPRVSFKWLVKPGQMNVFVPVLMGAGVVLSAIAWAVERLARATAGPVAERSLAGRLATVSVPANGFLHHDDPVAQLRGPIVRSHR